MEANDRLFTLLIESGAVGFGVAEAQPVPDEEWERFSSWISQGRHAGMTYMENYPEIRRDPRNLLEGAKSIVSVAYNYRQPNHVAGVATYALGEDYHKVLRKRLKTVLRAMKDEFGGQWRICVDSAPILERYWAEKSGVGSRSAVHGNIIVPGIGSMVFLAELITTLCLEPTVSTPRGDGLAKRQTGMKYPCPYGALLLGGAVDSRRCVNYLTIEKQDELSADEMEIAGSAIFGCDICLRASEENRGVAPDVLPEFRPLPGLEAFLRGEADSGFILSRSPLKRSPRFKN